MNKGDFLKYIESNNFEVLLRLFSEHMHVSVVERAGELIEQLVNNTILSQACLDQLMLVSQQKNNLIAKKTIYAALESQAYWLAEEQTLSICQFICKTVSKQEVSEGVLSLLKALTYRSYGIQQ